MEMLKVSGINRGEVKVDCLSMLTAGIAIFYLVPVGKNDFTSGK